MFGHENCGCYLSYTPINVLWFLPHADEFHGNYPTHCSFEDHWLEQLRSDLSFLRPGWVVSLADYMCYGARYEAPPPFLGMTKELESDAFSMLQNALDIVLEGNYASELKIIIEGAP